MEKILEIQINQIMKKTTNQEPNAGLDLAGFDYANLHGEAFKKYQEIADSLQFGQKYDYEVWNAGSKMKFGLDENTGEKYQFIDGIVLYAAKPIEVVRISALQARELNSHVTHLTGNEYRNTSKYLLLKKPAKELEVA